MDYFNSMDNLNCQNVLKDSKALMEVTNKVYDSFLKGQYFEMFHFHNAYHFSNGNCNVEAKMKPDKIAVCEFNAGLYERSLITATKNITLADYPPNVTVSMFLNYALNACSPDFNLLDNFFSTLLLIHPPTAQMFEYYYSVLFNYFILCNEKDVNAKNLFLYILDLLISSLKEPDTTISRIRKKYENKNNFLDMTDQLYETSAINVPTIRRKEFVYLENLSKNTKIFRSLQVLKLIYRILECDFGFWVSSKESKFDIFDESIRPLVSYIFWPEKGDLGLINDNVLKLLEAYVLCSRPEFSDFGIKKTISDFISLLVEIIKFSDKTQHVMYPFVGKKLDDFAREFSMQLYEDINFQFILPEKSNVNFSGCAKIYFKQHWFNLLLRSHLLSLITYYQCLPELTSACDILEHIAYSSHKINKKSEKGHERRKPGARINSATAKKFKSYLNVNEKNCQGKTLLRLACEKNNMEEVKALLSFPELNINEIDDDGWTALHVAAGAGSIDCTKELLRKRKSFLINTRAQGPGGLTPLMCAAIEGHVEICRILLEHTGSILLEDVNENNQTAVEIPVNEEIRQIFRQYKENFVRTEFSLKNLRYDESFKTIIIFMCFDLIQQYFLTYKTKEIFLNVRKYEFRADDNRESIEIRPELDYKRFEIDIIKNIPKLWRVVTTLRSMPDFKMFSWFEWILSFFQA